MHSGGKILVEIRMEGFFGFSLRSSLLHLEFAFFKIGTFRVWPYIFTVDFSLAGWPVSGEQFPGPNKHQTMVTYGLCDQEQTVSGS